MTGGRTSAAGAGPSPMRGLGVSRRAPRSRKVWTMLDKTGHEILTPWAAKQRGKRKRTRKVAKQARKVNRG